MICGTSCVSNVRRPIAIVVAAIVTVCLLAFYDLNTNLNRVTTFVQRTNAAHDPRQSSVSNRAMKIVNVQVASTDNLTVNAPAPPAFVEAPAPSPNVEAPAPLAPNVEAPAPSPNVKAPAPPAFVEAPAPPAPNVEAPAPSPNVEALAPPAPNVEAPAPSPNVKAPAPPPNVKAPAPPPKVEAPATVEEAACKFPQLLADDPLIKPYLYDYSPLQCAKEKNWVYTTGDGRFYIDEDAERRHGSINCTYIRIDRYSEDYPTEVPIGPYANATPLDSDSFRTQCQATDGTTYDNLHVSVPYPVEEIAYRINNASSQLAQRPLDLNVFIYLMDSVSRINFVRKLPKLYALITETMHGHVMEGFNVVGDGTPWAVIPMLTGHFQTELPEARRRFENASYIDDWPFVFKNYTAAGYVTSYAEEQPQFSAFTYKLKGFNKSPVDHYLRTMLLAVNSYKANHPDYCLGDTPRSLLWCNFWRELQTMYRPLGGRQFSMMFSSETSHDDYNTVQSLDEHWTRAFGELYRENFLNDTLLVIMGDHGRRFGPVRQTQTGKLEEKLPFLAVVTPPSFRKRFPLSEANLYKNRHRLVTAFDLYATFMHLLDFQEDGGKGDVNKRGLSLFREIPAERTCANAHIKAHFCSCLDWTEIDNLADPIVLSAAQQVIDYFNKQRKELAGKCAKLTLGKIISARLLKPNDQLMAFKESLDFDNYTPNLTADKALVAVIYQIRFTTEPGGGDWEASLTYFMQTNTFSINYDDISRLNAYHEQARCVIDTHPHLRTFCYCV